MSSGQLELASRTDFVLHASLIEVSRRSTYNLILGRGLVAGRKLGALGTVLTHAPFVAVIETHATVHPAAFPLVNLTTAGGAFRYVRGFGAGDNDFIFYLGFAHFNLRCTPAGA
jgi:hypothetical protein